MLLRPPAKSLCLEILFPGFLRRNARSVTLPGDQIGRTDADVPLFICTCMSLHVKSFLLHKLVV